MSCSSFTEFLADISRKKRVEDDSNLYDTPLRRTFTTFQLILLGMGTMIGAGLYVLTGVEAKEVTGPAIVLAYILAAIASALAAACYVEFACSVPRTGSAYTFTYLAVGEIWAFLIGWNLILEYAIAAASVATSFMGYLDSLCGSAISNFSINVIMGGNLWSVPDIAPYPDIFSALFVVITGLFIITGANISSWVNGLFLAVNMVVICFIVAVGFVEADVSNWQDYGGFFPYGADSVIAGAATLFFSYVGFDTIAMASEETVDPKKSIPRATFISLLITCTCYVLASAVLTLMIPYTELDQSSAFEDAFAQLGLEWTRWIVGIGALCAMFTTVLMNLYCLPRSIYAMATDGLLFECLGRVSTSTKVPVFATLLAMAIVVVPTLLFTLSQLVDFLSIGVLMGYTFVAGSVLSLRYKVDSLPSPGASTIEMNEPGEGSSKHSETLESNASQRGYKDSQHLIDMPKPSALPGTLKLRYRAIPLLQELLRFSPGRVVNVCLFASVVCQGAALAMVEYANQQLSILKWWAVVLLVIFVIGAVVPVLIICLHKQKDETDDHYTVPCVPLIPVLSIFCNVTLLLKLNPLSWLRFLVWVVLGILIYVFYGYRHSKVGRNARERLNGERPNEQNYGSTD